MTDNMDMAHRLRQLADELEQAEAQEEEDEYDEKIRGYSVKQVLDDVWVTVYEDADGDYWIRHDRRDKTILVSIRNELHTVLTEAFADE